MAHGVALAVLAALLGTAAASGEVFGNVFMASLLGGPFVGMLIGAMLDRAYEAYCQRNWLAATRLVAASIAVCIGISWFMMSTPWGPDIDDLTRRVRACILSEWRRQPDLGTTAIQKIDLERAHGAFYTGVIDATFDGLPRRFSVKVAVSGRTGFLEWQPLHEKRAGVMDAIHPAACMSGPCLPGRVFPG